MKLKNLVKKFKKVKKKLKNTLDLQITIFKLNIFMWSLYNAIKTICCSLLGLVGSHTVYAKIFE